MIQAHHSQNTKKPTLIHLVLSLKELQLMQIDQISFLRVSDSVWPGSSVD